MVNNQDLLDEAYPIIDRLAKIRSINGSFAYYDSQDVSQEVWCMCLDAMDRYDPQIGPIENYLARHVSNRMKNLKRDRYFRPGHDIESSGLARIRMNLVNAIPLGPDTSEDGTFLCSTANSVEPVQYLICNESLISIIDQLSDDCRSTVDELLGNNPVKGFLLDELRQEVTEILREMDDNVEKQE